MLFSSNTLTILLDSMNLSRTSSATTQTTATGTTNMRKTLTLRARNGDSLSDMRRALLTALAAVLVIGCAILSLSLRAVPKSQLAVVCVAVVYVQAAHVLLPAERHKAPAGRIRPLATDTALGRATIRFFLLTSLVVSLVVPWGWLTLFETCREQQLLLAPHLFLMMTQVLFEIWSYRNGVNAAIRIGVPVGFVSYRLRVLMDWVWVAAGSVEWKDGVKLSTEWVMLGLAVINLVFWSVILFYVLLLKVCPPYFVQREQQENEARGDQRQDSRTS